MKAHPIFFVTGELHFRINTNIIFYAMPFSFRCHNDNESFFCLSFTHSHFVFCCVGRMLVRLEITTSSLRDENKNSKFSVSLKL